jgi:hypothetical protein
MFERLCVVAGYICKAKLHEFVFYNLKAAKLLLAYVAEQNVTEDRTWDIGRRDTFNNESWY